MAISARIEELERKFNENPRRYFAPLANEYRKAGDLTQAISICRTYVPQQPAHMSGHIVFGQALFEAGEFEEARGVFESALQLDPENLIALRHLGDIAREHGELSAARTWYRRVLDADPRNPEVVAVLSSIDGLPDSQAKRQSSPVEALAGWQDINPERTLELPPTLATPAAPVAAAPPPAPVAEVAPPPDVMSVPTPVLTPAIEDQPPEGFFSGERDLEEMNAAPPSPDTGMGAGFESMEFVAPVRESRPIEPVELPPESDTPAAFVTETMAELYLQQGFRDEALGVYRQLLAQNPGDDNLRERVAQLESGARSSISVAAVSDSVIDAARERRDAQPIRSVRSFFGALAARRVVTHHEPPPEEPVAHEPDAPEAVSEPEAYEAEPEVHSAPMVYEAEPEPHAAPVSPVPEPEPLAAEPEVHAEPVAEVPAPPPPRTAESVSPPPAPHGDAAGYSDEAFSDDAFGAGAFTSSYKPRASAGILAHEDFSSESLVSRVTEEVDIFGLPVRTEQSEPEPEPATAPPAAAPVAETPAVAAPEAHAAPEAPEPPEHDGSVNGLFTGSSVSANDDAAASTLAGAFGGQAPSEPERAVRPAANELSLDSVFRESPGSGEGPTRRESSAFSFDQFFGSDNTENISPIEGVSGNDSDSAGVETEQFSSWLSGLKKK